MPSFQQAASLYMNCPSRDNGYFHRAHSPFCSPLSSWLQSTASQSESTSCALSPLLCRHLSTRFVNTILPYVSQIFNPPAPIAPTESPLRFGILGAATIAPIALILPVKNHPDAVVGAVAARDQGRADAFAKKHGIPKAYGGPGSYQSTRA